MQNRKHLLFLVFSAVILFSVASQNYGQRACGSVLGYQDSPYWRANFVFTGIVEKFNADNKIIPPNEMKITDTYQPVFNLVRFVVKKNYRGTIGKTVEITSSFNFKEGEKIFCLCRNRQRRKNLSVGQWRMRHASYFVERRKR